MSTVGAPEVCVEARTITGSSMVVIVVSIVVVLPWTVRLPVTVRSDPYTRLLAILPLVIE